MTGDERLASIFEAIFDSGLKALVMGGHAVRYYGVERTTIDFDMHLTSHEGEDLFATLNRILGGGGEPIVEAPSWRPNAFRRFIIGRLPDGREERLECWLKNHLLPPFQELYQRRSEGVYGGKRVAFLGLKDLIRSKETEREDDWRDIEFLEEIHDQRLKASAINPEGETEFLSNLRSRRGFELAVQARLLEKSDLVALGIARARNPITRAFLTPFLPPSDRQEDAASRSMIEEILRRLYRVVPGSARHLALVEAMRRLYKREAMEADRLDKLAQGPPRL